MAIPAGKAMPTGSRGFTLIELLVALVAASLLTVMIMNGADLASRREQAAEGQGSALTLAAAQLEYAMAVRRQGASDRGATEGAEGDLRWALTERVLMRDPRGLHQLIELEVRVTGEDNRNLARLARRLLIRVPPT